MSAYTMYIVWAAAIIGFAILEGITFQLVSIWFVFGSLAAFIASLLGASVAVQVIIWLVVSVLALAITRPLVKKKLTAKIQPTNADRRRAYTRGFFALISVNFARTCKDFCLPLFRYQI